MKHTTEQIITATIQADETITDKSVIEKVISVLSGNPSTELKDGSSQFDRVISRQEVQRLFGFKSPKSVDQYARKNIFLRVTLPGNTRASGYSESSVRKALASRCN